MNHRTIVFKLGFLSLLALILLAYGWMSLAGTSTISGEMRQTNVVAPSPPAIEYDEGLIRAALQQKVSESRGSGVHVGIIDTGGFDRIQESARNGQIPALASINARCHPRGDSTLTPTNRAIDCDHNGPSTNSPDSEEKSHGTKIAEIIWDYAPNATLYISNASRWERISQAAEWMTDNDVTLINYSRSHFLEAPGNGRGYGYNHPLDTIDDAVGAGALWVNAAGNEGGQTWYGRYSDTDNDKTLDWFSDRELNRIWLKENDDVTLSIRWGPDNWNGARNCELNIYAYGPDNTSHAGVRFYKGRPTNLPRSS